MENQELINHETNLALGKESPKSRLENQVHLAVELIKKRFPGQAVDLESVENRNEVMEYWVKYGYSEVYKILEDSDAFKKHPRLKGDIYKLTADDIISFKEKGMLPDDDTV